MSFNETPSAERIHIGFFGLRNAGKSSLVNAVTGQNLSLVSEVKGTTTDPVRKAMELLPLGPVVIIDTPGMDDEGDLGQMRVEKARQVLRYTDIAVLVVDSAKSQQPADRALLTAFQERQIPYIIAYNKCDLLDQADFDRIRQDSTAAAAGCEEKSIFISAQEGTGIHELKEFLGRMAKANSEKERKLVADLLQPGDLVILVTPIDESAPKGRMILPQQMVLRDVLDAGAMAMVCRETELEQTLASLSAERKPRMVITDSQVFGYVSKIVPEDIPLTSFSILMVRYKGNLEAAVHGAAMLSHLNAGDRVLISEGCTHHRQCNDIGTVKMPEWIRGFTRLEGSRTADADETAGGIQFEFTSGGQFSDDLSTYSLIVHCGGCMLNDKEMQYRTRLAAAAGVPMTNYGIAIAQMHRILKRSVQLFPGARAALEGFDRNAAERS